VRFHAGRHPRELGGAEVTSFLSHLAVERKVSASTQNQASSAILFLFRDVLEIELPWLDGVVRAKRPVRVPVVLSRDEIRRILACLEDRHWLAASLLSVRGFGCRRACGCG
jgi:integrase